MRRTAGLAAAVVTAMAGAGVARADEASLYRGPGPRPGPDILYAGAGRRAPADERGRVARRPDPGLGRDRLPRRASSSTRTSSTTTTARAASARPGRPAHGDDTFSGANGTYTYPTDPRLRRQRGRPRRAAREAARRRDRVPAHAEHDAGRRAGRGDDRDRQLGGAAAVPARRERDARRPTLFLTVHGATRRPARRRHAAAAWPAARRRRASTASAARSRSACRTPPGTRARGTVRLAAGVGLWDAAAGSLPRAPAAAAHRDPARRRGRPGRATGVLQRRLPLRRAAARQVERPGRHGREPGLVARPRAGRRARVGRPRRASTPTSTSASSPPGPTTTAACRGPAPINRILASHFETEQGVDFNSASAAARSACQGELRGRLQPYALYVPGKAPPAAGYGLTLLLHSLGANYNQFSGSRNQSQFGERGRGLDRDDAGRARARRLVLRPRGRGRVRGVGRRRAPLRARPRLTVDRRLLDGRLRHVQARDAVPGPVRQGASRRSGRPASASGAADDPPAGRRPLASTFRQLASLRNIPFLMWNAERRPARPARRARRRRRRRFDDARLPLRVRRVLARRAPHARDQRRVRAGRGVPRRRARSTATRRTSPTCATRRWTSPTRARRPTTRTGCRR